MILLYQDWSRMGKWNLNPHLSRSGCEISDLGLKAKSDLMNRHTPPPSRRLSCFTTAQPSLATSYFFSKLYIYVAFNQLSEIHQITQVNYNIYLSLEWKYQVNLGIYMDHFVIKTSSNLHFTIIN